MGLQFDGPLPTGPTTFLYDTASAGWPPGGRRAAAPGDPPAAERPAPPRGASALSAGRQHRPARHRQPWTPEEDEILRRHWGVWSGPRLARRLRRPVSGLPDRAAALGLGREDNALRIPTIARILGVGRGVVWRWLRVGLLGGIAPDGECHRWRVRPEDLERFIRQHPERVRPAQMDREGYPYWYNLARQTQRFESGRKVKRAWTAREIAYLRNNYRGKTVEQLAAYVGRSPHAVNMQLWRMRRDGCFLPYRPDRGGGASRRPWTPAEDAYLLAHVGRPRTPADPPGRPRITLAEVAAILGRQRAGVAEHFKRLHRQAERAVDAAEMAAAA
jgi:transposase